MTPPLETLLSEARSATWKRFGRQVTFYVPGMFVVNGKQGSYPALSLTGDRCELQCDHCRGRLLTTMRPAESPQQLLETCIRLEQKGALGCLISGGSDANGRLPWANYFDVLREIKSKTRLHLSVHAGITDAETALGLKDAGVDQALVDVVGADETLRSILHLHEGVAAIARTLENLYAAGLDVVPHICIGLHRGQILGERRALQILRRFHPKILVWIVLMPLADSPMLGCQPPSLEETGRLFAESRLLFPDAEISLGCARPRGPMRPKIERLAIDAGISRMALYSDETVEHAKAYGLRVNFEDTCCSVSSQTTSTHEPEREEARCRKRPE